MRLRRLGSWFSRDVYVAITNLIGGVIIVSIVEGVIEYGLHKSHVLYFMVVLLIVFATTTLVSLRDKIEQEVKRSRILVHFRYKVKKTEGDSDIYEPLFKRITRAKSSIIVVNGAVDQLDENPSSARRNYYNKLNDFLKEKMEKGEPFLYERILQVKNPTDNMLLRSSQIDEPTFEHCNFVLNNLTKETGRARFTLFQVQNVTATCAFMIIDDVEVVLFLPWIEHASGRFETSHLGKAIFLQDHDGTLIREMREMYGAVARYAKPIEGLEPKVKESDAGC